MKNHVFDESSEVLRDIDMATNVWLSVGYNSGCAIASE